MCDRFFIVNPVSGSGKSRKLFEELLPQIERSGRSFEWRYTTGKGHARELAEEASRKGCQRVISVGGDGTANEVAYRFGYRDGNTSLWHRQRLC